MLKCILPLIRTLICTLTAQVRLYRGDEICSSYNHEDVFGEAQLEREVDEKPMILPFQDIDGRGITSVLRDIMEYHIIRLRTGFLNRRQANFKNVWDAYQSELALEELLFGRPLNTSDHELSKVSTIYPFLYLLCCKICFFMNITCNQKMFLIQGPGDVFHELEVSHEAKGIPGSFQSLQHRIPLASPLQLDNVRDKHGSVGETL